MDNTAPRRRQARTSLILSLVAALLGVIGLAACSSSDTSGSAGRREVSDVKHTGISVPVKPERVVTLSEPALDGALALGVTPAGTVAGRGLPGVAPYLADKAKDVPIVAAVGKPDYEKIAALKPDLILTDGTSSGADLDSLEILGKIAPVVYSGHAGGPWKDNLLVLGDALNRKGDAEKFIADYDTEAGRIKGRLAPKYGDKTFSVVRWQGNGPGLILKELLAGRTLTDVGLKRPAAQDREGPGHSEPVPLEKLADIDADYLFFGTLGGASVGNASGSGRSDADAARAAIDKARTTPGFDDLGAVKSDHVLAVPGYWTSAGGPLLVKAILADIDKALP